MGIPIACGHCNSRFTAPDGSEGKVCKCPKCGQRLTIGRSPPKAADARELESLEGVTPKMLEKLTGAGLRSVDQILEAGIDGL